MKEQLASFYGNYASEEETAAVIQEIYQDAGYIMDPHTAVAAAVYKKYQKDTQDDTKTVIVSTASPYKFTRSVMTAIDKDYKDRTADELEQLSNVDIPKAIQAIRTAPVIHKTVCEVEQMEEVVKQFLNI